MTLPASGQLSLNDINIELGNTSGAQASLHTMSIAASKSTPDAVSEFYSFSNDMKINLGITTVTVNTASAYDAYAPVIRTTQVSGQIITINCEFNGYSSGGASCGCYYSTNSGGSWLYLGSIYSSSSTSAFSITGVAYNTIVWLRVQATTYGSGQTTSINEYVTGGTVTSGAATTINTQAPTVISANRST